MKTKRRFCEYCDHYANEGIDKKNGCCNYKCWIGCSCKRCKLEWNKKEDQIKKKSIEKKSKKYNTFLLFTSVSLSFLLFILSYIYKIPELNFFIVIMVILTCVFVIRGMIE